MNSNITLNTGLYLRTSYALEEQFRFPRTKKRRIRRKWEERQKNWRPILNKALLLPDGTFVCHPAAYESIRQSLSKTEVQQS